MNRRKSATWTRLGVGAGVTSLLLAGGLVAATVQRGDAAPESTGVNTPTAAPTRLGGPASPVPPAGVASASETMSASGTKGLFDGARYAAGASSRPSKGGVVLSTPYRGRLSGTTIVVDPGHNGHTAAGINNRRVPDGAGGSKACNSSGTATTGGSSEHRHNWEVGVRLAADLRRQGARVVLTRPNDAGVGPCVDERAAIGNRAKADLVISIHADGASAGGRGFHVIRSLKMAGGSRATAASTRDAIVARDTFARMTGLPRSTYLGHGTAITPRRDIAGMNLSKAPAIMLESGNMRNAKDARLLTSSAFQSKEAAALTSAAQQILHR